MYSLLQFYPVSVSPFYNFPFLLSWSFFKYSNSQSEPHTYLVPNTAVFGPTNFIGTTTTIASTARMKICEDEDFYG